MAEISPIRTIWRPGIASCNANWAPVRLLEARVTETKSLDQALAEAFSKADHLQAPLDQRLKLYLGESRKLLPEMEKTYDQLVARITANIEDSNQIPGVGEVLPDFCMTDSEGQLVELVVELATLLNKGPLVVSFNRGPWCDYCGLELHSLAAPILRSLRPAATSSPSSRKPRGMPARYRRRAAFPSAC